MSMSAAWPPVTNWREKRRRDLHAGGASACKKHGTSVRHRLSEIVFGEIRSNFNSVAIIAIMDAPFALAQKPLAG
jgi:hypothetical protein